MPSLELQVECPSTMTDNAAIKAVLTWATILFQLSSLKNTKLSKKCSYLKNKKLFWKPSLLKQSLTGKKALLTSSLCVIVIGMTIFSDTFYPLCSLEKRYRRAHEKVFRISQSITFKSIQSLSTFCLWSSYWFKA